MQNWYKLLDKDIIACMIGDIELRPYLGFMPLRMPYMTGKEICEFGRQLGINLDYSDSNSRKELMTRVLEYCIEKDKINEFFNLLLDLKHFKRDLKGLDSDNVIYKHNETKTSFIMQINGYLMFENVSLEYDGNIFSLTSINDETVKVSSSNIEKLNKNYAYKMYKKACHDIEVGDYDSAITKIRTMVEEVLIEGLKRKNINKNFSGDIKSEYSEFKSNYNMHIEKAMDVRIKKILSGLETIIDSIAEMRNANSDSHGVGDKRETLEKSHAILYYNSGVTLVDFLMSIIDN